MRHLVLAFICLISLAAPSEAGLFSRKHKTKPSKAKYGVSRAEQAKRVDKARASRLKARQKAAEKHAVKRAPEIRVKSSEAATTAN